MKQIFNIILLVITCILGALGLAATVTCVIYMVEDPYSTYTICSALLFLGPWAIGRGYNISELINHYGRKDSFPAAAYASLVLGTWFYPLYLLAYEMLCTDPFNATMLCFLLGILQLWLHGTASER